VRVDGRCLQSPRLQLVGRTDGVCDLRGEKLNPVMVSRLLEACQDPAAPFRFAMLAPDRASEPPGYLLLLGDGADSPHAAAMGRRVEAGLAANPHYAHCRSAGQLSPLRVFVIKGAAQEGFLRRCVALGQIAGTIKSTALSRHDGWDQWFDGRMMEVGT
jgi:GH3 auxin-responsive promoter